jgi:hypothetical protein
MTLFMLIVAMDRIVGRARTAVAGEETLVQTGRTKRVRFYGDP